MVMMRRALALIVLVVEMAACTSTRIEYDRMTRTAFPTPQTRNDTTFSIPSIYARQGYLVAVDTDQTNIAALTGPANPSDPNQYDYITEAELSALETANRSSSVGKTSFVCFTLGIVPWWCNQYHIYGIVVNHFYENPSGVRSTSTMGLMWTADNRRAFTNFYRNATVSGDPGKYLRSTVHEIGHAFDLHHPDGDGATDIMNQTGVVGNNYVYAFVAAASTDHLANHDKNCVWPSLSSFGATHTNHVDHGITTSTCP
jgi:hypothetical protein